MDPRHGNSLSPAWPLPDAFPSTGYNFTVPASQPLELAGLNPYALPHANQQVHSIEPNVRDAVHLLATFGLSQRQIRKLRKPQYRTALSCLAQIGEDDIDMAYIAIFSERMRPTSDPVSAHHLSAVPSLVSDQTSLRASMATDFSIPMSDSSAHGSGHVPNLTYGTAQFGAIPDEANMATTKSLHDSQTPFFGVSDHDKMEYEPAPQHLDPVTIPRQQPRPQVLSPRPDTAVTPSSAAGERNRSKLDPANHSFFISSHDRQRNRPPQPRFPCPERGCRKDFSSTREFAKHLCGDHDKNVIFHCLHCQHVTFQTGRAEMWTRHHKLRHASCLTEGRCVQETRGPERKYWGCGLCLEVFTDAKSYASHYADHFKNNRSLEQSDVSSSTTIQSLLMQDATHERWQNRNARSVGYDGLTYHRSWDRVDMSDIRDALEYGSFEGASISEPDVAERLLDEIEKRAIMQPSGTHHPYPVIEMSNASLGGAGLLPTTRLYE
ncbi:hypothetical protein G647_09230 [Cladophialophora carrionii CBS 160.54]|uniref:C2H2-type domain-containing protein n=1 Tax=Cladophialophora carrionii CBS 160.54 TaxID=1279043 RepID=V9D0B9_9EURO|nr:uncharacterized protein G647_09230 [Cladophialophora carrionii CBS 160.54]ETI19397.1 hypothetical protein G647_09230 [Cladophialophora carrionii CBS 160.54]